MSERAGSRLCLAAAALIVGLFGEVVSPVLFNYRATVDWVIFLQMLSVGLFLSGFYMALGEP